MVAVAAMDLELNRLHARESADEKIVDRKLSAENGKGDDEELQPLVASETADRWHPCIRADGKEDLIIFHGNYYLRLAFHMLTCFVVLAYVIANVNYVVFKSRLYVRRFGEVVFAPWLLLMLACEIAYLFGSIMSAIDNCILPGHRPPRGYLDTGSSSNCPTVDVFVPCCKEPTDVPVESIRAALSMDYPKNRFRVFVLDDGGDDALMAECAAMKADHAERLVYLRRSKIKGVPHHFKCGNLNYGLTHSDAEFVVMMDADMILHRSFLRRLLPYLVESPQVAFVQIPQSFYNLEAGDPLNDACLLGYDRVLPHRDSIGSANCVGTGAIFRRKHLDAIGGFQPQSITEDTMTAFTLFNQGLKSVYLRDRMQIGLTPWTFEGYVKQRARWGQGAMQQFVSSWRTMLLHGSRLNLVQKSLFIWHTGYYFLSIANVILMITLLLSLAFMLRLTVGDEDENVRLIVYLSVDLLLGRMAWLCLWWDVPQAIQSKNREESHFWWMTPFFFTMCIRTIFAYNSTFEFVPTSNIDRGAAAATTTHSSISNLLARLQPVTVHMTYAIAVATTVGGRSFLSLTSKTRDCKEDFFVIGISVFLLTTAAHMLVPVIFLLNSPANLNPSHRKSLLRYDPDGVPIFPTQKDCLPKWTWSVIFYELLGAANIAFWAAVLVYGLHVGSSRESGITKDWCK